MNSKKILEQIEDALMNQDELAVDLLDKALVICESDVTENAKKQFQFILENNTDTQRILSYIISNYLVEGAMSCIEKNKVKIFYEYAIEKRLRQLFFKNMVLSNFKYMPITIYILGEEYLKHICLNRKKYELELRNTFISVKNIESSLYSRALIGL
ncbi:hypothetical protein KQI36_14305 [Clostridium senegalense]|uniref:hypothetical protein n=1 Tax=Clostridium senegalense TaxID=1465809 RepID=UPI001C11A635|nr:hypothetical protein [Clostridium senegalense]MBU5227805.1 hypothetical protein [Clostridium senegalense]